jgi:hypothetical protein
MKQENKISPMGSVVLKWIIFFCCGIFCIATIKAQGPYSNKPSKVIHTGGGSAMIRTCEANNKVCVEPVGEKKLKKRPTSVKNKRTYSEGRKKVLKKN